MGMTTDGLSYWQAETAGTPLLDVTIGDLLDRRRQSCPRTRLLSTPAILNLAALWIFAGRTAEYQRRLPVR